MAGYYAAGLQPSRPAIGSLFTALLSQAACRVSRALHGGPKPHLKDGAIYRPLSPTMTYTIDRTVFELWLGGLSASGPARFLREVQVPEQL